MGTPDFAVGILDTIHKSKHNIVGVITAPDKPAGRGQKISMSKVKEYATAHNLPVLQPTNLKDQTFIESLKALNAHIFVVVAFRMLPKEVWQLPQLGTFNLHASLLPEYRGAAPINWAIINGESKTGVTTFFIDDKIDTGAIILKKETTIEPTENAGELHDKLLHLGKDAVLETLELIENNNLNLTLQIQTDSAQLKTAYKLNKENTKINWNDSLENIYNKIRGLAPYPSAWTNIMDHDNLWAVKLYKANKIFEKHQFEVGKIIISKKEMKIATKEGFLSIESLQFPGKKQMNIIEFINGSTLSDDAKAL